MKIIKRILGSFCVFSTLCTLLYLQLVLLYSAFERIIVLLNIIKDDSGIRGYCVMYDSVDYIGIVSVFGGVCALAVAGVILWLLYVAGIIKKLFKTALVFYGIINLCYFWAGVICFVRLCDHIFLSYNLF